MAIKKPTALMRRCVNAAINATKCGGDAGPGWFPRGVGLHRLLRATSIIRRLASARQGGVTSAVRGRRRTLEDTAILSALMMAGHQDRLEFLA